MNQAEDYDKKNSVLYAPIPINLIEKYIQIKE